jgi:hypothetical protein
VVDFNHARGQDEKPESGSSLLHLVSLQLGRCRSTNLQVNRSTHSMRVALSWFVKILCHLDLVLRLTISQHLSYHDHFSRREEMFPTCINPYTQAYVFILKVCSVQVYLALQKSIMVTYALLSASAHTCPQVIHRTLAQTAVHYHRHLNIPTTM